MHVHVQTKCMHDHEGLKYRSFRSKCFHRKKFVFTRFVNSA